MSGPATSSPMSSYGDLDAFFRPASIAVVGASGDPSRSGGRVMATLAQTGFAGRIHPVTPSQERIGDLACVKSLAEIGAPVDQALICVSAERVPAAIRECAAAGVRAAVVFADGFAEPALRRQMDEALDHARATSGLRVIGPNTIGNRVVNDRVYATIATDMMMEHLPGTIATIGQSGGLSIYFGSAYLRRKGIGSKYVIDTGGEFDVDAAEALDWVADDPDVTCAALILEGCRDGRRLMRAVGKMRALGKPVVFWKTGRSQASAAQIASHTGTLAGRAKVFEAGMRAAGAIVVSDEIEFVDTLAIASAGRIPAGRRLGVVTPSGGFAIVSLDAAERAGLEVPAATVLPTDAQQAAIGPAHFANPLDVYALFGAGRRSFEASLRWMAGQPDVDALVVWQSYANLVEPIRQIVLATLSDIVRDIGKPVYCCGMTTPDFESRLREVGVVWFEEPTRLVQALGLVAPKAAPAVFVTRHEGGHDRSTIGGRDARMILSGLAALPHVESHVVETRDEAEAVQRRLGRKVFLKIEAHQLAHKTEAGGVLGPLAEPDVGPAFDRLKAIARGIADPSAEIVLQPAESGVELALGAFVDEVFGPSVMVATGGIFLEVMKDTAFAVAPVGLAEAREMILGLGGAPLLLGARGKPLADVDAAAAALVDLSHFIAETGHRYREIDINPLMVREKGRGVVAVDALLVTREKDNA